MRLLTALLCGLLAAAPGALDDSRFLFVDIQPQSNHALKDDMGADFAGNNLANLPRGEQTFEGTPFRVGEKMIRLRGMDDEKFPVAVEGIKVNAKFKTLHILHATEYSLENADDKEIGAYVIHYADNTEERIPIVYGKNVQDWWAYPGSSDVTDARVAWTGTNPGVEKFAADNMMEAFKVRLFSCTWTNPHPEKEVTAIDATSRNTQCRPFVVALTAEKE